LLSNWNHILSNHTIKVINMKRLFSVGIAAGLLAAPAAATTWTDWTSASSTTASGDAGGVTVSFSSTSALAGSLTAGGTNYYTSWPTGAAQPSNTDILMLGASGTRTITFSQAVTGVQLALVSWNVPGTVTFNHAFANSVIGCGYWGCGSISPVVGNTGFTAHGEVHGTLTFAGPISTLTINDGGENWHGLTVGYEAYALMLAGLGLLGLAARRKTSA
jgi:hypothetical protein